MAASAAPATRRHKAAEHPPDLRAAAPVPHPESTPSPEKARNPAPPLHRDSPPFSRAPTPAARPCCCRRDPRSGSAPQQLLAPIPDSESTAPPKAPRRVRASPSQPLSHCWHRAPRPELSCRSEEHTSELQSLRHLVCRLLLEKKTQHTY